MPVCEPKTLEARANGTRWELVVGKALKDWVTRVMNNENLTRAEARKAVLATIEEQAPRRNWACPDCGRQHLEHGGGNEHS